MISEPLSQNLQGRAKGLQTREAQILLRAFTPEMAEKFSSCYLKHDIESSEAKEVISHLLTISPITRMVMQDKTSSITFEYLYHKKSVDSPIDAYFPQGKAAKGIYRRLRALKEHLPLIILKDFDERNIKSYRILNIGSGPSHEMIEMLQENPDLASIVHVTCIEPDQQAINIGQKRIAESGLASNFSFLPIKLQDFRGGGFDLLLIIGILCPMNKEISVKILKNTACFCRIGGLVVFSTVQTRMGEEDPLTDYIMRLAGWRMDYKQDHEPYNMAIAAGWQPIGRFFDSYGFNCMTVARLTPSPSVLIRKSIFSIYSLLPTSVRSRDT